MNIPQDEYWKKVGNFAVDAGIVWIGDPCYVFHRDDKNTLPDSLGKSWDDFCDKLGNDYPTKKSFGFNMGHEGLGLCLSTGYGDGFYPVYARILNGRIMQIFLDFDGEVDDDIYGEDIERDED